MPISLSLTTEGLRIIKELLFFSKLGPIYGALKIELTRMVNEFYDFFILVFASPRIILAPVALQNK